jgi:malonyl-CoA/methylmalonyl-CoA synthetase
VTGINLIRRATGYGDATAIVSARRSYTYADLLGAAEGVAAALLDGAEDLQESRVAFLIPGSFEYAAVQWASWLAGGIAVPLSMSATSPELEHVLTDADVGVVLAPRRLEERVEPLCQQLGIRTLCIDEALKADPGDLPNVSADRRAMILYTSGTTSKPKGVVTTHANIEAQILSLIDAWEWQRDDRIPLFLPLHHVHGIVNVLSCALWSGAQVETFESQKKTWARGFANMRLMISGSAALPVSVHEKWTELTGQKLLERYGMTEIGMGISNLLHGERRPGAVGQPLPGVEVRLVTESGEAVEEEHVPGEIQIRGPNVFGEYWRKPEVTGESFAGGWFRTGDMAVLESGYYRILGRLSVDIIKSGGYKLSALEIEDVLRQHPAIKECAVVGVADEVWGEAVAAAVVKREGTDLDLATLRSWAGARLSKYKIPKLLQVVPDFPRNAMGKVMKPAVREMFQAD